MKGSPMKLGTIQGTAGHRSALKMKMEQDAAAKLRKESAMKMKKESPFKNEYAKAKEKDPKLDSYIRERDKHEPGSAEYEAQQSKINAAYGKKRDPKLKEAQIKNLNKKKNETKTEPKENNTGTDKETKKLKSNNLKEILFDVNKDGNVFTRLFKKKDKKSDDGGGKTMIQKKKEKDAENKKIFGKSPGKMKKESPAKIIRKKTDREKLNKLVKKREEIRDNVKERDEKDTKFLHKTKDKIAAYRLKKIQKKINKNPEAIKDKKRAEAEGAEAKSIKDVFRSPSKMKKGSAMKLNKGFDRLPKDVQAKIMKNKK